MVKTIKSKELIDVLKIFLDKKSLKTRIEIKGKNNLYIYCEKRQDIKKNIKKALRIFLLINSYRIQVLNNIFLYYSKDV